MTPFVTTYTGRKLNPLEPMAEDIVIEDIAHALACCNRFAGHARYPISVAQHSLGVSLIPGVPALQGLLHDAAEAYLGDMTKWVKSTPEMAFFRECDDALQRLIFIKYGCPAVLDPAIEQADRLMVRYEYHLAFDEGGIVDLKGGPVPGYPPVSVGEAEGLERLFRDTPWAPLMTWQQAEQRFLDRFERLDSHIEGIDVTTHSDSAPSCLVIPKYGV